MTDIAISPIDLDETPVSQGRGETPLVRRNLAMLGHVNVRLDVVLGHAEIDLQRLFSLAQDDVVTLEESLDAPVTLRLDGKSIARGSLVAVGDKFGLKIIEILE